MSKIRKLWPIRTEKGKINYHADGQSFLGFEAPRSMW